MKIIRIIISAIVVVLAVIVIITEASTASSVTPYMLIGLGTLNIFNGVYLYRENKKTQSMMIFSIGLFAFIVVTSTLI